MSHAARENNFYSCLLNNFICTCHRTKDNLKLVKMLKSLLVFGAATGKHREWIGLVSEGEFYLIVQWLPIYATLFKTLLFVNFSGFMIFASPTTSVPDLKLKILQSIN